jgi:hypothetical protein
MGQLVFQATLGGQVNLVGPNTASTFNLNVPATSSTLATLTGTETFTNKTLTSPTLTTPVLGTPASGTLTNCTSLPVGGITATGTPSSTTYLRGDSTWATITATTPGGSTTQVQYNSSGSFAGSANMTFSGTALTLANDASISGLTVGKGGGAVANNTAVGVSVLANHTTNGGNVGVGYQALITNTTGYAQTAVGRAALYSNTTGASNVAVGQEALQANTTASNNTAVGYQSAYSNTTGTRNTAIGYQANYTNTTGVNTTAVGAYASNVATVATTSFGTYALYANTSGTYNSAFGGNDTNALAALQSNTTGSSNCAFGGGALGSNTTGANNTAVGYLAGRSLTTGSSNIALGYIAGDGIATGSNNIHIGNGAGASTTSVSGEIVIGNAGAGKGTNSAYINPNGSCYQGSNSTLWSVTSDQRLKKNIVDNTEGLDIISQILIRNFEYRTVGEVTELPAHTVIEKTGVQLGVIAQELQQVCSDCVKEESTGVLSVDASNLTWHMINAIKDLKALVDAQATEITALKAKVGI